MRRKKYQRPAPSIDGGFGKLRRHLLQRRQIKDHEEAGILPNRDRDQADQRGRLVAEPVVRRDAEQAQHLVEQAVARRIEEQPDIGDRDHRQHGRGEERQPQKRPAGDLAVDPDRHGKRKRNGQRNNACRVDDVVGERAPEHRVAEHGLIIIRADERRGAAALWGRKEAVDDGGDGGIMGERHQQHRRRQQQQPTVNLRRKPRPRRRSRNRRHRRGRFGAVHH